MIAAVAATAVGFIAVSSQSFWIDEANSALKATSIDLTCFISSMLEDRGSDMQMPLYMLMLWGWEKVFGHSEFALRAMNIPLFVASLVFATTCWRANALQRCFFILFACSSAFLWAYLDEARPYIMQFLGATACAIPLANLAGSEAVPRRSDIIVFAAGVLILCASSLMGVISSFWFSVAFFLIWLRTQLLADCVKRSELLTLLCLGTPLLLLLAAYYAWTLFIGARASSVGQTSILSMLYAAYELLGMAGLGPGRAELRLSPASILPFVPHLALYAFAIGILIVGGVAVALSRNSRPNTQMPWIIFWSAPAAAALTTLLVGIFGDFRVVGRHLMPIFPFLLIFFSIAAAGLWRAEHRLIGRIAVSLAVLAMIGSAAANRLSERHAKDDYRSSAAIAREALAQGKTVWWAADPASARFYGVNICEIPSGIQTSNTGGGCAHLIWNPSDANAIAFPIPDMLILSKADIYDRHGVLRQMIIDRGYSISRQFPSFSIYAAGNSKE